MHMMKGVLWEQWQTKKQTTLGFSNKGRRLYQRHPYLLVALFQRLLKLADHFSHLRNRKRLEISYFLQSINFFVIGSLQLVIKKMKAVFYSLLVFAASVMPNTSLRGINSKITHCCFIFINFLFPIDTETLQDSSASAQSSLQMGTMTDKDSSMMSSSSDDGQQVTNIGDKSDEVSDTSELSGFNLSLFPTASIFGANPMFQKLQGKH